MVWIARHCSYIALIIAMLYHLSNNLDCKNSTTKFSTVHCVMQGGDITLAQFVAGPDDSFSPLYILFFQASLEVE